MKNLILSLIAVLFLSSCSGSGPTACGCADMAIQALTEAFENLEMSEEEGEKMQAKWEKKMKPCEEKGEADSEFRKEMEKCLAEKMMEEDSAE